MASDASAGTSADRTGSDLGSSTVSAMGSMTASALDLMVRMPLQVTAASLEWMTSGMQRLGQGSSSGSSRWQGGGSQAGHGIEKRDRR